MRPSSIIPSILALIIFGGCGLFDWHYSVKTIDRITPDINSDSFKAILYDDTLNDQSDVCLFKKMIGIDSNGRVSAIAELDTSEKNCL